MAVYAAFTVIGIGVLAYAARDWAAALEARAADLQSVEGQLQRAAVERASLRGRQGRRSYEVHVAYSYSFQGQEFEGHRLGYGRDKWLGMSQAEAEKVVREIQSRDPFIVYVDRSDARRSVLFDNRTDVIGAGTIFVTLFGCVFALIGGVSLLAELVSWRRSAR